MLIKNVITQKIPENSGVYYFLKNDKPVYFNFTADLQYTIKYLLNSKQENIVKMVSSADSLEWKETENRFQALSAYKQDVAVPESKFRISDNYVYLGIALNHDLTCYVCDSTIDDYLYIGPFPDRFKLYDYFYTIKELYNLKSIENNSANIMHEDSPYSFEFLINDKHESLKLAEKLLFIRTDWISELQMQAEQLKNKLNFEKADLLERQIRLLNKVRKSVEFCLVTKNISYSSEEKDFAVEHGMLSRLNGKKFAIESTYRDNEEFAVSKDSYDERKAVLRHLENNFNRNYSEILSSKKIKLNKIIYGG